MDGTNHVLTKTMQAQEICDCFNASADRQYWRAAIGGSRTAPTVNFNSRGSMVQFVYHLNTGECFLSYSRTACAFGDFMASAYRSLWQILSALKSAGLPFACPVEGNGGVCRFEYDPDTKQTKVALAKLSDPWTEATPVRFKDA